MLQQPAVADEHHGKSGLLGGHAHLGGGDRLFSGVGQYRQLAVGLKQCELDGLEVGIALDTQLLHQLVQGEAVLLQLSLHDLPVLHNDRGLAAQQGPEFNGPGTQHGDDGGQRQQHYDGDQSGQQGNAVVLHGDGGQVGDDEGEHQLGGLQFADLVLTQQPDACDDEEIKYHGAYEYYEHKNTSFLGN